MNTNHIKPSGLFQNRPGRGGGFTLVELMVVMSISILLMTVGALIYSTSLRIYRESQGLTEIFQTSKLINRDLKDYLGSVVPLKGNWVNPIGRNMGGGTVAAQANIDRWYLHSTYGTPQKQNAYSNTLTNDKFFSWTQYPKETSKEADRWKYSIGYNRSGGYANWNWHGTSRDYPSGRGWWLPAYFGRRDGTVDEIAKADNVMAGSWGWPRPDYRLDGDADEIAKGTATLTNGGNLACWFYAEDRFYNSAYTLALDNANIVLVSLKFSRLEIYGREETKLSILRHQIVGFDTATQSRVRADQSYGNLLRAVKIVPYYLDATGDLVEIGPNGAGDDALGWKIGGGVTGAGTGDKIPCCFDISYTLRNPGNYKSHKFATRIHQFANPQ